MNQQELAEIEARASATTGVRWSLGVDPNGLPVVDVVFPDGHAETLRVTRERAPASATDVDFVANARRDTEDELRGRDAPVPGSSGEDPFMRLAGDCGDALVVRVIVKHHGGVGLSDGGEHEVGDRGLVLPAEGQCNHDVNQVALGDRIHVQIAQGREVQSHPGQLLGVAGRVQQFGHRHQAHGQLSGLAQLMQALSSTLVIACLLPGRLVGEVQRS